MRLDLLFSVTLSLRLWTMSTAALAWRIDPEIFISYLDTFTSKSGHIRSDTQPSKYQGATLSASSDATCKQQSYDVIYGFCVCVSVLCNGDKVVRTAMVFLSWIQNPYGASACLYLGTNGILTLWFLDWPSWPSWYLITSWGWPSYILHHLPLACLPLMDVWRTDIDNVMSHSLPSSSSSCFSCSGWRLFIKRAHTKTKSENFALRRA